jgi:hypothetical protein
MSNFVVYSALSSGYSWVSPEMARRVGAVIRLHSSLDTVLKDPWLLNYFGEELLGMPYVMDEFGKYSFIVPILLDTEEDGIRRQQFISEVYKKIIRPIQQKGFIRFINNTTFLLYNDGVEITDDRDLSDVNIQNIITNVLSVYIVQQFKKGTQDE